MIDGRFEKDMNKDERTPLKIGTTIYKGNVKYIVDEVYAYGGFSLVYKVHSEDNIDRSFLIKELFPFLRHQNFAIMQRNKNGVIVPHFNCELESEEKENEVWDACVKEFDSHVKSLNREVEIYKDLRSAEGGAVNTYFLANLEYFTAIPNATTIDTEDEESVNHYLFLDLVDGNTLERIIKNGRCFSVSDSCKSILQTLFVLQRCHEKGYLHLDIAPDNIYVQNAAAGDIQVAIIDFNSAQKMDAEGKIVYDENSRFFTRKAYFSAPELNKLAYDGSIPGGQQLGFSTDLYSVAAVFYYLLTGKKYNATDIKMDSHIVNHVFPESIEAILIKGLQEKPCDRFLNVAEMGNAIEKAMALLDPNKKTVSSKSIMEELNIIPEDLKTLNLYKGADDGYNCTKKFIALIVKILQTKRCNYRASHQGYKATSYCPMTLQTFIALFNTVSLSCNAQTIYRGLFASTNNIFSFTGNNPDLKTLLDRYFVIEEKGGKVYVVFNNEHKDEIIAACGTEIYKKQIRATNSPEYEVLTMLSDAYFESEDFHHPNENEKQPQEKVELNITISKYLNCICMGSGIYEDNNSLDFLSSDQNSQMVRNLIERLIKSRNLDSDYLCLLVEKKNNEYLFQYSDDELAQMLLEVFSYFEAYDANISSFSNRVVKWIKDKELIWLLDKLIIDSKSLDERIWSAYLIKYDRISKGNQLNLNQFSYLESIVDDIITCTDADKGNVNRKKRYANILKKLNITYRNKINEYYRLKYEFANPFESYIQWCIEHNCEKFYSSFPEYRELNTSSNALPNDSCYAFDLSKAMKEYDDLKNEEFEKRQDIYRKVINFCIDNPQSDNYKTAIDFLIREHKNVPILACLGLVDIYDKTSSDAITLKDQLRGVLDYIYENLVDNTVIEFKYVNLNLLNKFLKIEYMGNDSERDYWLDAYLKPSGILNRGLEGMISFDLFIKTVFDCEDPYNEFAKIIIDKNYSNFAEKFFKHLEKDQKNGFETLPLTELILCLMEYSNFQALSDKYRTNLFHFSKKVKNNEVVLERSIGLAQEYFEDEDFWKEENDEKDCMLKVSLCTYYSNANLQEKKSEKVLDFIVRKILPNLKDRSFVRNTLNYKSYETFVYHIITALSSRPEWTAEIAANLVTRAFTIFKSEDWIKGNIKNNNTSYLNTLLRMSNSVTFSHPMIRPYSIFIGKKICENLNKYADDIENETPNNDLPLFFSTPEITKFYEVTNSAYVTSEFFQWTNKQYKNCEYSDIETHYVPVSLADICEPQDSSQLDRNSESYRNKYSHISDVMSNAIIESYKSSTGFQDSYIDCELQNYMMTLIETEDECKKYRIISGEALYFALKEYQNDNNRRIPRSIRQRCRIKCFVFPKGFFEEPEFHKEINDIISNMSFEKPCEYDIDTLFLKIKQKRNEIIDLYNNNSGDIKMKKFLNKVYKSLLKNKDIGSSITTIQSISESTINFIDSIAMGWVNKKHINNNPSRYILHLDACDQILKVMRDLFKINELPSKPTMGVIYDATITRFKTNSDNKVLYACFETPQLNKEQTVHIKNYREHSNGRQFDEIFSIGEQIKIRFDGLDENSDKWEKWTIIEPIK